MPPSSSAPSESARATTSAESRFRISAPNSQRRSLMVVAVGSNSELVVTLLASRGWTNIAFIPSSGLGSHVPGADHMVLIAAAGEDARIAGFLGALAWRRHLTTTALLVAVPGVSAEDTADTLAQLRPFSTVVVAPSSADYVSDMLTAMGALS